MMNEPMVTCTYDEYQELRKFRKDVIECFEVDEDEDIGKIRVLSLVVLHKVLFEAIEPYVYGDLVILFKDDGVSMLDDDVRYEVTENANEM